MSLHPYAPDVTMESRVGEQSSGRRLFADRVLTGGKVVTVDADFTIVEAVAVKDGVFLAVGADEHVRGFIGPDTVVTPLQGRMILPGLIDSHVHASLAGLSFSGVDLSTARSIPDVLEAIRARVAATPPGTWVRTQPGWMESQLREGRLPTPEELDSVSPEHPVHVQRTGFTVVLNSIAQRVLGIGPDLEEEAGTRIVREPGSGRVNVIIGLHSRVPGLGWNATAAEWETAVEAIVTRKNRLGITSYTEPLVLPGAMRAYAALKDRAALHARVNMMMSEAATPTSSYGDMPSIDFLDRLGIVSGFGDDRLRIGIIGQVGPMDGVPGGLLREPYTWMDGDAEGYRGIESVPGGLDAFKETAVFAAARGWRLGLQACGDGALDMVLDIFEHVNEQVPTAGRRHVVIHPFLVHDDQLERIVRLGLTVQVELHGYSFTPNIVKYWGQERAESTFPLRALLDAGVVVGLGTDAAFNPDNPFLGIQYFVTRETVAGVMGARHAISREEAVRGYTRSGAYLTFEEESKGSIEVGKLADLVVLSGDVLTCPATEIGDITAVLTMVGGRTVFTTGELGDTA